MCEANASMRGNFSSNARLTVGVGRQDNLILPACCVVSSKEAPWVTQLELRYLSSIGDESISPVEAITAMTWHWH